MDTPAGAVRYQVLGPFEVLDGGARPVALPGALPRRLLAALLLRPGRAVPVDVLADRLWGEGGLPDDVAGAVQTHVSRTRRLLAGGAAALVTAEGGYRLDVAADDVDVRRFERLVAAGLDRRATDPEAAVDGLDAALALWRGPAWAEFADWDDARAEASRLGELRLQAHEERAEALLVLGRQDEALIALPALVADDPRRERVRALLMRALYQAGRQAEALREYASYRRSLAEELGLDPSPALRELERAILDHSLPPVGGRFGGTAAGAVTVTVPGDGRDARGIRGHDDHGGDAAVIELPRAPNRLIGREATRAALVELVAGHRVVTLAGPGGMGKTRVALEVAWDVARRGRRVVLCELAPLARGDEVAAAVATALGIEPTVAAASAGGSGAGLARALRHEDLLLVLDNCEHVVDAAAALTERLVAGTPSVTVLATSRERLAVAGEWVHALGPLADDDALALFVERAQAVRDGFAASDADHGDLLYICHRLDGLPLALELAAARTQALSVRAIADALSQRFRFLTGGRRAEQRHRSLLEAVRWSFDLLDGEERDLCERLAVCVGGFTVEAAAAVAGLDPVDAAELVARLVERSLVTPGSATGGGAAGGVAGDHGGHRPTPRFGMLETVRQYGLDRLAEQRRLAAVQRAHARYFVGWAQRQRRALGDPARAGRVFAEVDEELPNLRAAHAWLAEVADHTAAAELHAALYWFALMAFRPEVCTWAEADLANVPADDPRRADLLAATCNGRWQRGDVTGAREAVEQGLALAPEGSWVRCVLMSNLANLTGRTGDVPKAVALFDEVRVLTDDLGDPMATAINRFQRLLYGSLAGEPSTVDDAEAWVEEAEAEGNPLVACWARYAAGEVVGDDDPDRARRHIDAALRWALDSGCWFVAGAAGVTSASLEARHGDPRRAAASYRHLLDLWRRGALRPIESTMLRHVAELLAASGHADAAALLHGAVTSSEVAPPFGPDAARQAELAGRLRARLGDAAFAEAVARGARLGDDEALDLTAAVLATL
jgi:predicted ATPase/DNA-binding SARP family transcriptional activator